MHLRPGSRTAEARFPALSAPETAGNRLEHPGTPAPVLRGSWAGLRGTRNSPIRDEIPCAVPGAPLCAIAGRARAPSIRRTTDPGVTKRRYSQPVIKINLPEIEKFGAQKSW